MTETATGSAEPKRLRGWALRLWRGLWLALVLVYGLAYLAWLPTSLSQYTHLTGAALRMGYVEWSEAGLRAALDAAGLSARVLTVYSVFLTLGSTLMFVGLGLLLAWRRSDERMGLFTSLFLVTFGLLGGMLGLFDAYPGHPGVALLFDLPWIGFYTFFFVFPDGRFVPRWTGVWAAVLALLFGVTALVPSAPWYVPLVLVAFASAVLAQVYRYVRVSNLVQRAQAKWVLLAIALIAGFEIVGQGLVLALFLALRAETTTGLAYGLFVSAASLLFLLLPLALTIAILRYRLWDIDVLIRRTLIYSLLTGLLALAYFGSIVVLENLLRPFTGQVHASGQFVIVVSTLAIAALSVPLRSRVQAFIDRRFYRQKYDAARILAQFALSARDEVDLEALTQRLTGVVQDAMQPASVGLWLADTQGRSR